MGEDVGAVGLEGLGPAGGVDPQVATAAQQHHVGGVGGAGPWDDVVGVGPPGRRSTAGEPAALIPGIEGITKGFGDGGVATAGGHHQRAVGDDRHHGGVAGPGLGGDLADAGGSAGGLPQQPRGRAAVGTVTVGVEEVLDVDDG